MMNWRIRLAQNDIDVRACQMLRGVSFFCGDGPDCDDFDHMYKHLMVESSQTGQLVGTVRFFVGTSGVHFMQTYTASLYTCSPYKEWTAPILDVGRLCVAKHGGYVDVIRLMWAAISRLIERENVELICGCTSLVGGDLGLHCNVLSAVQPFVRTDYFAPRAKVRCGQVLDFKGDARKGVKEIPAALQSYLSMGGWLGPDVVQDNKLGTCHMFTGLFVKDIPAPRLRALNVLADMARDHFDEI